MRRLLSLLVFAFCALGARAAKADPTLPKGDLAAVFNDSQRFVHAVMSGTAPTGETPAPIEPTKPVALPPIVDFLPRASIVARDWRGSMRVAGARTLLLDDLRPSGSMRMVTARIASDARLAPFVQIGAGQWRIDPAMFPHMPRLTSYAGQVAAGFELRATQRLTIGGEAQYNVLYREESGEDTMPRFVAVILAAQSTF
jgi:hypothetical protein